MIREYTVDGLTVEIEDSNELNENSKARLAALFVAIREKSGMSRKEFAEWLGIPYRTMQDWELGVSKVPDYLLRLIAYKVKMELLMKGE